MTKEELLQLIKQGEDFRLEAKKAENDVPVSVWESYAAFCNTDGGVILLGVSEDKKKDLYVSGVQDSAKIIQSFWNQINNKQKVSDNLLFNHQVYPLSIEEKELVVIEVPRADRHYKPVFINDNLFNGTFRRNAEGDYHCTREEVKAMLRDQSDTTSDCTIAEDVDWSGNLFEFYFRIIDRLTASLKIPFRLENGLDRIDDTPAHGAVREALANALIHADYYGRRGLVIEKHKSKLIVSNPGTLRITPMEALEGGISDPRNSLIFKMFVLVNVGERIGSGLQNIRYVWKKMDLPEPQLVEKFSPDRMRLEIPLMDGQEGVLTERLDQETTPPVTPLLTPPLTPPLSPPVKQNLTDLEERFLELLSTHATLSRSQMSEQLGIGIDTVKEYLRKLRDKGYIERIGGNKSTGYWVVKN